MGWNDKAKTVLPLVRKLMGHGVRVLVYRYAWSGKPPDCRRVLKITSEFLRSGDVDGVVPVTSTRFSVDALGLRVESPWRPWTAQGEVRRPSPLLPFRPPSFADDDLSLSLGLWFL